MLMGHPVYVKLDYILSLQPQTASMEKICGWDEIFRPKVNTVGHFQHFSFGFSNITMKIFIVEEKF